MGEIFNIALEKCSLPQNCFVSLPTSRQLEEQLPHYFTAFMRGSAIYRLSLISGLAKTAPAVDKRYHPRLFYRFASQR